MVRARSPSPLAVAALPRLLFAGRFSATENVPFHRHDGVELILVTAGSCAIAIGGERLEGTTGTVFVVPAGTDHDQLNHGHVRTTYVVFHAARQAFAPTARALRLDPADRCGAWIDDLCRLFQGTPGAAAGIAGGLLLAVLERLNELDHHQGSTQALPAPLARAVRYIERRQLEPLSVGDIARQAGVSASHLRALFRARFASGPLKYQLRLKLQLAAKLLGNSYLSVAEVGAACGFRDPNYFARIFRAHHGLSPRQWRQRTLPKTLS
jgi:AraC-like DNA-binding protein